MLVGRLHAIKRVQAARNPLVSMQPYLRGRLRGLDDTWYLTRSRGA